MGLNTRIITRMTNKEVAETLEEIAMLLELSGENPFKTRSYTNMARTLEGLDSDVATLVEEERLREIKGLGEALEQKITELVTTGKLEYLEKLRAQFPETLFDLFKIPGLGAKRIKQIYDELEIDSLDSLQKACDDGRLDDLKGFGPKMQQNIREGIEFAKQHQDYFLCNVGRDEADALVKYLKEDPNVIRVRVAGSLRRWKEVVHDVDFIACSEDPKALMQRFVDYDRVTRVNGHGETKSSVVLETGIQADLRVVTPEQYPYALMHFTGSKEHNIVMRQRAKDRNMKLSEYGLFKGEELIECNDEASIYEKLELPYIPPEMREDMGEFDADDIPELIEPKDLRGVIHCHSTYSDGKNTLEQMAEAAKERGYKYFGIADHSQTASYAGGLRPSNVEKQHKEIDKLNKQWDDFTIVKGIESDILADGSLDYDKDVLASFDYIVASVHSGLKMDEKTATKRVVAAIQNPYTTILGHPTGRLLLQREGFPLDWDEVFSAAAEHRVAIEINAHPRRLDLDWRLIQRAKEKGCMFSIGPDAHSIAGFKVMRYGLGTARKGWLTKNDIINCLEVNDFKKWKKAK